jgi:hypothetical protein
MPHSDPRPRTGSLGYLVEWWLNEAACFSLARFDNLCFPPATRAPRAMYAFVLVRQWSAIPVSAISHPVIRDMYCDFQAQPFYSADQLSVRPSGPSAQEPRISPSSRRHNNKDRTHRCNAQLGVTRTELHGRILACILGMHVWIETTIQYPTSPIES